MDLLDEFKNEVKENLQDHTKRLNCLEKQYIKADLRINNLCEKLESLITTLNKLSFLISGAFLTGIVTLIIFMIEKHV